MSSKVVWGRVLALSLAGCLLSANLAFAQSDKGSKTDAKAPAASQEQPGQQDPLKRPLSEKQQKQQQKALKQEISKVYKKWMDEDVRWIIGDEERGAFKQLSNDEEREQFIEQFWLRRDPTPDSTVRARPRDDTCLSFDTHRPDEKFPALHVPGASPGAS